jgi:GntR family transcriptional repressor for pyruvate dehydrogenase complex
LLFQAVKPRKLSQEIVDQFLDAFARGILQPGEVLPGERELAQQFQVSRPPLREALKVLETMGVIRVEQRKRIVVQSMADRSLRDPLARAMETNPRIAVQMLEVRAVLEAWAAQQAAEYASPSEVERLENWMRRIEASMNEPHRATWVNVMPGRRPRNTSVRQNHASVKQKISPYEVSGIP